MLRLPARASVALRAAGAGKRGASTKTSSGASVYVTFRALSPTSPSSSSLATIILNSPRANTFDYSTLLALSDAIAQVEAAKGTRALVLSSAIGGIFSGGFHLPAFSQIARDDFLRLWTLAKTVYRRIHALPVPSIAAINGHALGLGCVLAMACQRRFMVQGTAAIGLNEAAVGLPVPEWLAIRYRDLTSPRAAEQLLPTGASLSASQALEIGLVDAIFESRDSMDAAAASHLLAATAVSQSAQAETIRNLRCAYLRQFDALFEADNEQFWCAVSRPETQQGISDALAQLKARSRSKGKK
ncbi:ClpP/crotonase [Martensiomyces pterosporus]|nr:ClpP/crotonase [Martensiomyces pterosporus]